MNTENEARITFNLTQSGVLELWLNEAGRELLIEELQSLSPTNDHFHFDPLGTGNLNVSTIPYRETDRVLDWGKVYLSTDESAARHFPHVLGEPKPKRKISP